MCVLAHRWILHDFVLFMKRIKKRLWTLRIKLMVLEGRGGGCMRLVVSSKEGTYCIEHWVLYISNKSWNAASKTNDILYDD